MFRAPLLASVAALTLISAPVAAQTAAADAQRQDVFEQLLVDPANRQLMRDYARLSVAARDFEAAAATLERLVDLEPNNTTARVELAVAYFALGSYAVAEYHFAAAQASGTLTPEQMTEVARYREEAQERDDRSDYSGRLQVGYAFADTSDEQGAFVNGSVDWRIDMGDADVTQWVTEFAFSTYQPGDASINERTNARLRTGPQWRLASDAYGPRLQAYAELGWFQNDDTLSGDYTSWGAGLAYANPINERFTVYADLGVGREIAMDAGDPDFDFYEFDLGVTYRPSRDTRLRLSGTWSAHTEVDAATPIEFTEASVRLAAQHAFDVEWDNLPNRWVAGAFAEMGQTEQDVGGITTDFDEYSYGLWLRAFVFEDIYIETAAAQVHEDTTPGGTREEMIYTFQVGWEF
ncbi:tetratricopeptide repeat protein [Rhodobacteraceae bacterium N5(2021)]|uniref:Tetratricopeptide repeat protein n=1 Tax=Gymnodinialimonas phycosphaerae TaxID=2841589 RepID=A0A975YGB8_9RHOB|nr:tetratricopeptide repeat protein [Gymnodinialimonas phycosphaerae]MBY4891495.1 tetratricopeptide repeat protein [Gymnodinialimonas phycosphaerae]